MKKKANILLAGIILLFFLCLTVIAFNAMSLAGQYINNTPASEFYDPGE